ncbi:hypothetical protein D3C78_1043440 [compost metagenome]
MQINAAKSALQNVIDLFNTKNSQSLTTNEFDVAAPVVRTPDANPHNSSVTISAKVGSETHKGSQTFTYTRLDIAQIATIKTLGEFQSVEGSTLADAKAFAVAALGLIAAEVDFVEVAFPTFTDEMNESETATLTLKAKDGSYAYLGEVVLTVVEPVDGRERMSELYSQTQLDGFDYPVA